MLINVAKGSDPGQTILYFPNLEIPRNSRKALSEWTECCWQFSKKHLKRETWWPTRRQWLILNAIFSFWNPLLRIIHIFLGDLCRRCSQWSLLRVLLKVNKSVERITCWCQTLCHQRTYMGSIRPYQIKNINGETINQLTGRCIYMFKTPEISRPPETRKSWNVMVSWWLKHRVEKKRQIGSPPQFLGW